MTISHVHPLLLLLIVSLFVLPALGVKFQKCSTGNQNFIEVKTVMISPDPVKRSGNANITITGYTSKDIPDGAFVNLALSIWLPVSTKSYSFCDVTACPVAPGPFVLSLSNVFTEKERKLTRGYNVVVTITEKREYDEPMMCVMFGCIIKRAYVSLLSQVTRWISTKKSVSGLEGFFLRLRLGKWEEGLGGTGYHVARIDGAIEKQSSSSRKHSESTSSISVKVGGMTCFVESQFISNHDFLKEELKAWWRSAGKSAGRSGGDGIPSAEELSRKIQQRKMLGF